MLRGDCGFQMRLPLGLFFLGFLGLPGGFGPAFAVFLAQYAPGFGFDVGVGFRAVGMRRAVGGLIAEQPVDNGLHPDIFGVFGAGRAFTNTVQVAQHGPKFTGFFDDIVLPAFTGELKGFTAEIVLFGGEGAFEFVFLALEEEFGEPAPLFDLPGGFGDLFEEGLGHDFEAGVAELLDIRFCPFDFSHVGCGVGEAVEDAFASKVGIEPLQAGERAGVAKFGLGASVGLFVVQMVVDEPGFKGLPGFGRQLVPGGVGA